MSRKILALFLLVGFSGCATAEKQDSAPALPPPAASTAGTSPESESIDMDALERSLKLGRPQQELGYQEAGFNTCSAGYGFSSTKRCRNLTMAVINFRIQCRDSEGTISTALGAEDLRAIAGQGVHWTLQKQDGATTTDGEGYATVRGLFQRSPKNDWLRIMVNTQFLNMRAQTITRVVAPRPWCHAD